VEISVLSKRRRERTLILVQEVDRLNHIINALNGQVIQESQEIERLMKELAVLQDQIMGT
jgi:hypothetical protein